MWSVNAMSSFLAEVYLQRVNEPSVRLQDQIHFGQHCSLKKKIPKWLKSRQMTACVKNCDPAAQQNFKIITLLI